MRLSRQSKGGGQMRRAITTFVLVVVVGFCATALAVLPELVEELVLIPGVLIEEILILALPVVPFAVVGLLSGKLYRTARLGSLLLVSAGANAVLHFFGCAPLWQRHTTPGLIYDSWVVDLLYHLFLVAVCCGTVMLRNRRATDTQGTTAS